ncbi:MULTISPECIES: hypothetical protein [Psychrobacillus]|uniref:hypothetical protein n=1 Tax=Psychrobacillus TaxID=1221880 RepID=UPI0030FC995D
MKKLLTSFLLVFILISSLFVVKSEANGIVYDASEDVSVDFDKTPTEDDENIIKPLTTFPGSGGYSGLDWGASGRMITWRVKPDTLEPWVFSGILKVYQNDVLWKTYTLSGAGVLGSTGSDTIELPYMVKGEYRFKLSGAAVAPIGNVDFYTVSSNAELTIFKSYSD